MASRPPVTYVYRLTYKFSGTRDFRLADVNRIRKRVPVSLRADDLAGRSGFWYQSIDANGAVLYRRAIIDPVAQASEYPGDEEHPLQHATANLVGGELTILVPDSAAINEIVVFTTEMDPAGQPVPVELVRNSIEEIREQAAQ